MVFDKQQLNLLYRFCYMLTTHRDDAYDLLQTSIEKFLKNPAKTKGSEMAYLRRIIRNQFIDQIRRVKRVDFESFDTGFSSSEGGEAIASDVIAMDTCSLESLLINEELVEEIGSILNVSEREIVFLWAVEGYTAAEISKDLDMPRGTILSKIHRLKKKVNAHLANEKGIVKKAVRKGMV